ncbi:DUF6789 family protein [Nocardia fusca]|uniref:DUF6789 family protein n=1 Tax=Nocardia fusca TaxID=941183 RepID=UPI0007A7551A|nr:DUF6789 family protein [Nocardia fusca]
MATGAALLGYFLTGVPLWAGVGGTVGFAVGAWAVLYQYLTSESRVVLAHRVRIGLLAGAAATAAYDLSRYMLVAVSGSNVRPFAAWPLFGELLGAGPRTQSAALVVGFSYHLVNGLGFAVAFTVVLGDRGVLAGVAWALILEALMVSFYPGWLGMKALAEFVSVTIVGHVVYGIVLGFLSRRLVRRDPRAGPMAARPTSQT